jgi:hypothetical protein
VDPDKDMFGAIVTYSDSKVIQTSALFGTVMASLLPVIAIVILYLVHSMEARLGLVATFTMMFSTSLWFLSDGRLMEVFAATSA